MVKGSGPELPGKVKPPLLSWVAIRWASGVWPPGAQVAPRGSGRWRAAPGAPGRWSRDRSRPRPGRGSRRRCPAGCAARRAPSAIAGVDPGGVERHEHHRGRVGVAGVEVGGAVGIVLDEQEVPAAVAVLGGDEPMDGGGGHRLMGGDQPLDGERLR